MIGANGAGKSTLLKSIAGLMRARRDAIVLAGEPVGGVPAHAHGGARRRAGAGRPAAVSLADGRGESGDRRPARPARRRGRLPRVYDLFPVLAERRAPAEHVALGRPAADGGDRPRADVQPARCCCATRSASDWRRSSCARSTRGCRASCARDCRSSSSSRTSCRRSPPPTTSTACRRGAWCSSGIAGTLTREAISAAYFGV